MVDGFNGCLLLWYLIITHYISCLPPSNRYDAATSGLINHPPGGSFVFNPINDLRPVPMIGPLSFFSFLSFLAFSMVALPLMGRLYPQLPVWSTPPKLQNHMSFCLVIRRGSHSYRKGVISNYSAPSSNIRRICKVSVIFQLPSPQTETVHNYPPTSAISISLKLLW